MRTRDFGLEYKIVHRNADNEVLYESEWEGNQVSDDGFEHMFDTYFCANAHNGNAPTSFVIGLLKQAPAADGSDSYADLVQVTNGTGAGDGYALQPLTRDATGYVSILNSGGDTEITTAEVSFQNTDTDVGNVANVWDTATHAFLAAVYTEGDGGHIFLSWKALSIARQIMPQDTLAVTIRQKGKLPE